MSNFNDALDVLHSANDNELMNGAGKIDGIVPDLTETTLISGNPVVHNHIEPVQSQQIVEPEYIVQSSTDYRRLTISYKVGSGTQDDAFAPI